MAKMSDYLEEKLAKHATGEEAFTMPTTLYLSLYTDDPGDDDSGTELSGNGYVRKAITFAYSSNGTSANDIQVTFDAATAAWGTITHWSVHDALSAGNMLFYGDATTPKDIGLGDVMDVPIGNISATFS